MDNLNKSLGKVSIGVSSKPFIFTFVPVVQTLPVKNVMTEDVRSGALTRKPNKNSTVSHEETSRDAMSDGEIFKAEKVFIKESVEEGAGNTIQLGTEHQLKPSPDHVSSSKTKVSPSESTQAENMSDHVAARTASMETGVGKHRGISQQQCHDTSGLAETHKIKLSYKSLAAIPTNTLLLDQQAIDEQVEREESPLDGGVTSDRGVADTHAEMCSPAQLRQQSEELYAVIDEILANSIPAEKTSRSLQSSKPSTSTNLQNSSSFPKSMGRETKYASLCTLHPSTGVERHLVDPKKTKPGVIRPMTAIPRLRVEDEEEFHPNPFRRFDVRQTNKKAENTSLEEAGNVFYTSSKGQTSKEERRPERRAPFFVCDLQITEPEDRVSRPVKDASTPFSPAEVWMEAFETHI